MRSNVNFDGNFPDFEQFISSFKKDDSSSFNYDNNLNNSINSDKNPFGNIDMNTILKMKQIIEKTNNKNNPRTNLLLSLKPYLKPSKKQKVDQFIQLFSMEEVIESLKPLGGEEIK